MTGRKLTGSPRGLPGLHCRRRLCGTLGGRLQEPGRAPVGPNCTMNTYWLVPEDRPALHTKHVRWLWGPLSRRARSRDPGAAAGVQSEALNAEQEGGIPTDCPAGSETCATTRWGWCAHTCLQCGQVPRGREGVGVCARVYPPLCACFVSAELYVSTHSGCHPNVPRKPTAGVLSSGSLSMLILIPCYCVKVLLKIKM